MNAKEAHDLYSKAAEVVGWPTDGELVLYFDGFEFFWVDSVLVRASKQVPVVFVFTREALLAPIPAMAALALCRWSCVEWLMKLGQIHISPAHLEGMIAHSASVRVCEFLNVAPTIDAALVAAVLAVAGGKK